MGAQLPRAEAIDIPEPTPLSALGASSAAVLLARAGSEAARAAARYAIAQRADAELSAELGRAARRLRALRDRWIPQHEQALAALDLTLDAARTGHPHPMADRAQWFGYRPLGMIVKASATLAPGREPGVSTERENYRCGSTALQRR